MIKSIHLLQKIRIHPTLWLILGLSVLTAHFLQAILLIGIVLIHELGHAIAASYYNWRIKSVTLLPFGGMLETDENGNRPLREEFIVTISGPLQHFWMVGAALILAKIEFITEETFSVFFFLNLGVLLFNLFPIWPLDGGKLLFLYLSRIRPFLLGYTQTLQLSMIFCVLLFVGTLVMMPNNLSLWIMIAFLVFSLWTAWKQKPYTFIRFLLERHYGRGSNVNGLNPIVVDENEKIYKVLEKFNRDSKHPIIVTKNGRERGTLDETELLHAYFSEKMTTIKIGELLYSY